MRSKRLPTLLLATSLAWVPAMAAPAPPTAPLRTAAQDNNSLKYDLQSPHKPGICVEVLRAVERQAPELRFEGWQQPMSLPRIEAALADGSLDAFCALLRNSAREARFDFIDIPVYTVRHRIAVRANDSVDVRSLADIRALPHDKLIIVSKGTAHEDLLRREGGLELDASSRDTDINLRKLLHRRGRFFYHTENALLHYIEQEGLQGKIRLLPPLFKEEGMYLVTARSLPAATAAKLKAALKVLHERGELQRIYESYKED
jgi:ABC-type amino acid transport substrate-binding protein